MNFEQFPKDILGYFETNLPTALNEIESLNTDIVLPEPDLYIENIPDMARSESIVFYLLTPDFHYEELSNDSKLLNTELEFYITFKNLKNMSSDDLTKIAKRYANAIYNLVDEEPSIGIVGAYSMITSFHFYEAAEGFQNAKAIKFMLRMTAEI